MYGEKRNVYLVLLGHPKKKNHLGDLSIVGRVILKWLLKR
jgi:hypothetical protein